MDVSFDLHFPNDGTIFNNLLKLRISPWGASGWGIYLVSHLNYFLKKKKGIVISNSQTVCTMCIICLTCLVESPNYTNPLS